MCAARVAMSILLLMALMHGACARIESAADDPDLPDSSTGSDGDTDTDTDTDTDSDTDTDTDTDSDTDTDADTDTDTDVDTDTDHEASTMLGVPSGGGVAISPSYRLRLTLGGSPMASAESPSYDLAVGVGALVHQ